VVQAHVSHLPARGDTDFSEDVAQMLLDDPRAKEQPAADLPVGKTLLHQLGNLQFLAGELRGRCRRVPPPSPTTRREQLASGSFCEDSDVHVGQSVVRDCDLGLKMFDDDAVGHPLMLGERLKATTK
jgi:hypothetical protein